MSNDVILQEYSSKWVEYFKLEKELLMKNIDKQIVAIEHIGSTSINSMTAKPIIDLMIGIQNLKDVIELVNR